jgi:hypothetical protein
MFLWILRYRKKKIFVFFSMSFGIFVSFQKRNLSFCVFPISYTCLHVISYKCKYVLLYLNMLRLFQKINVYFIFFGIKLVL